MFAWVPAALSDGWTVWLESYEAEQVYQQVGIAEMGWETVKTWSLAHYPA